MLETDSHILRLNVRKSNKVNVRKGTECSHDREYETRIDSKK